MTLTADQITDIADDLEALARALRARDIGGTYVTAMLDGTASSLVSIAAMRAPVPQQASYAPPPPYPYGPGDFGQNTSVALHIQVAGRTESELKAIARQHGKEFFGAGADLDVALTGTVSTSSVARAGSDTPAYLSSAVIRQREPAAPRDGARYPDVPLG
jgi:hypothetical protein